MNNKKVLENVEKVELLETAANNMWYKAWAYIENNVMYVGRYIDVLKGRTREDIFKLGFGLYTDEAHKSRGLQNLFSEMNKEIDEYNYICNKIDREGLIKELVDYKWRIEQTYEGYPSYMYRTDLYGILQEIIHQYGSSNKDLRVPTITSIKDYVKNYYHDEEVIEDFI
jgi:predicted nuclease of restriction endonuclease-like RecB superfamily